MQLAIPTATSFASVWRTSLNCAPNRVVKKLNPDYTFDRLTTFLETVRQKAKFHYWLFAHYHDNKIIDERFVLLWEQIVQII